MDSELPAQKRLSDVSSSDAAPAVLKEDAIAKKPTLDGHEVVVKGRRGKMQPESVPVIHLEHAAELAENPRLKSMNDEVQALRKTDPKAAVEKADALIRTLEATRSNKAR